MIYVTSFINNNSFLYILMHLIKKVLIICIVVWPPLATKYVRSFFSLLIFVQHITYWCWPLSRSFLYMTSCDHDNHHAFQTNICFSEFLPMTCFSGWQTWLLRQLLLTWFFWWLWGWLGPGYQLGSSSYHHVSYDHVIVNFVLLIAKLFQSIMNINLVHFILNSILFFLLSYCSWLSIWFTCL